MTKTYYPKGTCSKQIDIELEDGVIKSIKFLGGCNGNLKGIAALCVGKKPEEIIPAIKGIRCGMKSTSCPDQLAHALEECLSL